MSTRTVSLMLGAVFILVGLVGFVPNPVISGQGLFRVDAAHNLVHILLGAVFITGAYLLPGRESLVLKALGVGGFVVAAFGFVTGGDRLLGLVRVNAADHWLHLGLAAIIFTAGVLFHDREPRGRPAVGTVRMRG